jgi:imidazolonepropionase-like amidohydrolase
MERTRAQPACVLHALVGAGRSSQVVRPQQGNEATMVERGMTAEQALLAGTRNAAQAIGAADRLGTLEPGKLADLIIVDGEPDRDVRVLQDPARIVAVMRAGRVAVDRRGAAAR